MRTKRESRLPRAFRSRRASTRRVLVVSSHFHFDEVVTFSTRHPPKPLPIRKEPHHLVPTR